MREEGGERREDKGREKEEKRKEGEILSFFFYVKEF